MVYFLLQEVHGHNTHFCGLIDNFENRDKISIGKNYFELESRSNIENIELFLGIESPIVIQRITTKFCGFSFPNLIHQSFIGFENSIKMGFGNIITPSCIFTVDVAIGSFNVFNTSICIGHDSVIGSYDVFLPRTQISGNVKIGNSNIFGMTSGVFQGEKIGDNNYLEHILL
ncbi:hypothetical protein [Flavobacterium sp. GT3P67]|uniref:hypothetical protein n=1 Tax=Flavobacterium sp. GT3P67 TaxID=2541722 RepID=UPI001047D6E3|nr:hypothetical protein [Flavobacterium sp. GT3P67]TDE51308.1 hypothetical protein E0H99_11930 [Flavobacterium sp. GT3P67]